MDGQQGLSWQLSAGPLHLVHKMNQEYSHSHPSEYEFSGGTAGINAKISMDSFTFLWYKV